MSSEQYQLLRVVGRVLIAFLLGFLVLGLIGGVMSNLDLLPSSLRSQPWVEGFLNHTTMWFVSLILVLILSKGKLLTYGFCKGRDYRWAIMIILGTATGVALEGILEIIPYSSVTLLPDYTFGQTVLFVWLYASISEEIFTRGLIQGFLAPLARYNVLISSVRISLPVFMSALFFGLMHVAILTTGASLLPVVCYVVFAMLLGLIAGYYREQTGSLIPAITVHIFGNIGGYCMTILLG